MNNKKLLMLGMGAIVLRSVLQMFLDHIRHSTDITDFALGLLFGVGLGLLMLFVWRNGRPRSC